MQKHLISLAFCLMFAITAKCDTVSFSFQVDGGEVRYGNVVCPDENRQNVLLVYVNHRMIDSDKNREYYSELTGRLLQEGISCCYYDNRKQSAENASSCLTLYDMADDAAAVYRSLKNSDKFRNYKIGFYGASEAGSSALIAASMVSSPAFLIQRSACVIPEIEKDFYTYALAAFQLHGIFTDPKCLGMPYHDYVSLIWGMLENMRDNKIGNVEEYVQTSWDRYSKDINMQMKDAQRVFCGLLAGLINRINMECNGPRLSWDARPYYKKVRCPILFMCGSNDVNVYCYPNLVEFEKIMYENNHKKYNTAVFNVNHFLLTPVEVIAEHRGDESKASKKDSILDTVRKWLVMQINNKLNKN